MLYRIVTEDKNRRHLTDCIDRHFSGYRLYTTEGRWKGKREAALVIEIAELDGEDFHERVYVLARNIKALNGQEAVLIEAIASANVLV